MPNDYLETEIILEDSNEPLLVGESRIGKIIIQPKVDLSVDSLGYEFFLNARGLMMVHKESIIKKELIRNKKIVKGKKYEYDLEIKGVPPLSYNGKNIELEWKVQMYLDLRTDSYLMVRNSYLKKKGLTHSTSTKDLLVPKAKTVKLESTLPYRVKSTNRELKVSSFYSWLFFILGSIIISFGIALLEIANPVIIGLSAVVLLFLFLVVPYYYKTNILRKLKVDTTFLGGNQFAIILGLTKNITNIKRVEVLYTVIEKVTDRRGSSDVVHRHPLFKSPTIEKHQVSQGSDKILDFPELAYDFIFDLPDYEIPTTLNIKDLEFIWEVRITVFFLFGLKSNFIKEIEVTRETENNNT